MVKSSVVDQVINLPIVSSKLKLLVDSGKCGKYAVLVIDGGTSSRTGELTSLLTRVVILSSGGVRQERAGPTQAVLA